MIPTLSNFKSSLQNLTMTPRYAGWLNGSPPANVIFFIPASASILRPFLACSIGSSVEFLLVWKQN